MTNSTCSNTGIIQRFMHVILDHDNNDQKNIKKEQFDLVLDGWGRESKITIPKCIIDSCYLYCGNRLYKYNKEAIYNNICELHNIIEDDEKQGETNELEINGKNILGPEEYASIRKPFLTLIFRGAFGIRTTIYEYRTKIMYIMYIYKEGDSTNEKDEYYGSINAIKEQNGTYTIKNTIPSLCDNA